MLSRLLLNFHKIALPHSQYPSPDPPSSLPPNDNLSYTIDMNNSTRRDTVVLTSQFDIHDNFPYVEDDASETEAAHDVPVDLDGHGGGGGVRVNEIEMVPIGYRT